MTDENFNDFANNTPAPTPFSTPEPVKQEEKSKPRPKRSNNRRRSNITARQVEDVLAWKTRLDSADDRTVDTVKALLKTNGDDQPALIASLLDGAAVGKIEDSIDNELKLLSESDLKAGIILGSESRDERRQHWNLAATAYPDKATEINGSVDYPASKDVYEEAEKIHSLQKSIPDYAEFLNQVADFLR